MACQLGRSADGGNFIYPLTGAASQAFSFPDRTVCGQYYKIWACT